MSTIQLDHCGNWYSLRIWPDGIGLHYRRFIEPESGILAYCDIDTDLKAWHLKLWQPRHERLMNRMAKLLLVN